MKGYVYCIRSHQTDLVYIGSTTQILCKRMSDHRSSYKHWLKNDKRKISSYEIIKYDDCYIELIEEGNFESKLALRAREGYFQRTMECVNKRIENQTKAEYYTEHKQEAKEYQKEYYTEHKQEIAQKQKEYRTEHKQESKEYRTEHKQEAKEYYTEHKQEMLATQKKRRDIKRGQNTTDEKTKQYYSDNKERMSQYYEDNKAHILERQNVKIVCECGCEVSKVNLPAHKKSKKHCVWIDQNREITV